MSRYQVKGPDGQIHEFEGPDGATPEEVVANAQKIFAAQKNTQPPAAAQPKVDTSKPQTVKPPKPKSLLNDMGEGLVGAAQAIRGIPEAVASTASGLVAAPVAGIAGIAQGAGTTVNSLRHGHGVVDSLSEGADAGANRVKQVGGALTYQPKSEGGKVALNSVNLPMTIASELLGKGAGAAGSLVGPKTEAAGQTIGENIIPAAMAAEGGRRAVMDPMKAPEPVPGSDYSPLRKLTPDQANRFFRMKGQGVDPTLGNVTREPSQVRFEQQTAPTKAGAPIDQRMKEQDAALADHLETLKKGPGMAGARDVNTTEAGRGVRIALEAKAASKWEKIDEAYNEARASGETKELVPVHALVRYLGNNESAAIAVPELNAIKSKLKTLQEGGDAPLAESPEAAAAANALKSIKKVSIDDLEYLRQEAGTLAKKGGSAQSKMVDVIKLIDSITEGKGGAKYKQARGLRRDFAKEFEDNAGVANILDKKTATKSDYKVATEDVWNKTVLNGSVADLGNVLNSLRSARGEQRQMATQSMKNMQAHTVDHILEQAYVDGIMSPTKLKKAINGIGRDKVELLLGKDAMGKLEAALQTTKDLKTSPRKVPGSDTNLNAKDNVERAAAQHAEAVVRGVLPPWAGRFLSSFMEGHRAKVDARATRSAVDEAMKPRRASMADINTMADKVKKDRSSYVRTQAVSKSTLPAVATMKGANQDNQEAK